MGGLFEGTTGDKLRKSILVSVIIFAVFLALEALSTLLGLHYIGQSNDLAYTITVGGHGEVLAVPDIATFSFSVVSDETTVAAAQQDAATKANAITAYLTGAGVDTNDIQTTDYSVSPQYNYQQAACPEQGTSASGAAPGIIVYCPPNKQVLTGYEVSQQTTVKVRDTSKAGDLLSGVGSKGATEVSGLTFTTDDPEALTLEAREKAVADAQQQAQALAKSLGVSLGRVTSFYDNDAQNNGPQPAPYAVMSANAASASAPNISVGQNDVTDDVSLTYEIH
jgi:uncharacterized protein YggE